MHIDSTPFASLVDVSHRYGAHDALSNVTLSLAPGEITALLGHNGAGKTTIVRLLTGLSRPTHGQVTLFGESPERATARQRLGVMLQVGRVPEMLSVKQHVELFSSYYPAPLPLEQVLELAGLTTLASRRYGALSGGERQRVQFALAICGNPQLLFLDEPTVGMDVESRRRFWEAIAELAGAQRSILLTTHYLEEADAIATRIVLLKRGRILTEGTPEEIKQRAAGRQLRCRTRLTRAELEALPGVLSVSEEAGDSRRIVSCDSDQTLRGLLARDAAACDLELRTLGLEDAFVQLNADDREVQHVA